MLQYGTRAVADFNRIFELARTKSRENREPDGEKRARRVLLRFVPKRSVRFRETMQIVRVVCAKTKHSTTDCRSGSHRVLIDCP